MSRLKTYMSMGTLIISFFFAFLVVGIYNPSFGENINDVFLITIFAMNTVIFFGVYYIWKELQYKW